MAYSVPVSYQYSSDPALRQAYWASHQMETQAESFHRDIERLGAVTAATGAAIAASNRSAIMEAQSRNADVMRENSALERQTMEMGFANLSDQMRSVSRDVSRGLAGVERAVGVMTADMNLGFARLENIFKTSTLHIFAKLDEIHDTLKNPRYTETQELYRQALENYNRGLYEEAVDELLESTKILKVNPRTWRLLGKIYLFGAGMTAGKLTSVVDLDAACDALYNALRYIEADAKTYAELRGLASDICFLLGLARLYKSHDLSLKDPENNQEEAERYLSEAQQAFEQSCNYSNKNLEARFLAAWCKAQPRGKIGTPPRDESGALADLEALITTEPAYSFKIAQESGFAAVAGGFRATTERLRTELVPQARQVLNDYQALLEGSLPDFNGKMPNVLAPLDQKLREYLAANPVLEDAAYYDLSQIIPLVRQCAEKLTGAINQRNYEQAAAEAARAAAKAAIVNMFGIDGATATRYNGPGGNVTIPEDVVSIGKQAFLGRGEITNVTIPAGVTTIGEEAFKGCWGLTSITIPASVTTIGAEAFKGCWGLTNITLPASVTTIGAEAFKDCNKLTGITIPSGVTGIGPAAFDGCAALTNITVDAANRDYSSIDGVLVTKDNPTLVWYPCGKQENNYTIPSGVTSIGAETFKGCKGLTSITIPAEVTSIGGSAFSDCPNLNTVIFKGRKTVVDASAFHNIGGGISPTFVMKDVSSNDNYTAAVGKWMLDEKDRAWKNNIDEGKAGIWLFVGAALGLIPLIIRIRDGHWFTGILIAIATSFIGMIAFLARAWGFLVLAILCGGFVVGIKVKHPVIFSIIGIVLALLVLVRASDTFDKNKRK